MLEMVSDFTIFLRKREKVYLRATAFQEKTSFQECNEYSFLLFDFSLLLWCTNQFSTF